MKCRTLSGSELNYSISEQELMAVVHALSQWRTLILGFPI